MTFEAYIICKSFADDLFSLTAHSKFSQPQCVVGNFQRVCIVIWADLTFYVALTITFHYYQNIQ